MLLAIVLAIVKDFCQVDYTVADKVVLLVVFVQTGYIERGGILGVTLVHLDVDLCAYMLQQALICGCLVNMTALFSSSSIEPCKREHMQTHTPTDPSPNGSYNGRKKKKSQGKKRTARGVKE